mgnify:FL=1
MRNLFILALAIAAITSPPSLLPPGNQIGNAYGGLLNVLLSKEGAPIYVDQSPSFIYSNPRTETNQNGVPMPYPNPGILPQEPENIVTANVIHQPLPLNKPKEQKKFFNRTLNDFQAMVNSGGAPSRNLGQQIGQTSNFVEIDSTLPNSKIQRSLQNTNFKVKSRQYANFGGKVTVQAKDVRTRTIIQTKMKGLVPH